MFIIDLLIRHKTKDINLLNKRWRTTITMFSHVIGSMTLEYVNYILWASEQSKNILLLFIHLKLTLGNLGGVILMTLFT